MTVATPMSVPSAAGAARRREVAPSGVVGMLIFVMAELMFFAGLLSAFSITRAGAVMGMWPPPGQPLLPAAETLVNTAFLLLSGVALAVGHLRVRRDPARVKGPLVAALALGAIFVGLQGKEWAALIAQGLTLRSGAHGAFFYLIVGIHALHAIGAILGLAYVLRRAVRGTMTAGQFFAAETFWYFVVLLWPVIYLRVYF
jgi:cytochrome c oxidase subunit 3